MAGGFVLSDEEIMKELMLDIGQIVDELRAGTVVLMVVSSLVSIFYGMLLIYFCITVGQLWQKHKIGGAIVCFFAVNFVRRILTSLISAIRAFYSHEVFESFFIGGDVNSALWMTLILSGAASVLFYIAIRYINEHQVNLD